jgi:hypothetical protein
MNTSICVSECTEGSKMNVSGSNDDLEVEQKPNDQ